MIVLHAAISDGNLLIWGEQRLSAMTPQGSLHPFACSMHDLSDCLSRVFPAAPNIPTTIELSLPTTSSGPLPSTTMLVPEELDIDLSNPEYKPWTVDAVIIGKSDVADFVKLTSGARVLSPGVILG